jgi:xanthosine utilization system XapX-like protein
MWATHLIAFLLGGLTWGTLLIAPPAAPVVALIGLIGFVAIAVRRRWR